MSRAIKQTRGVLHLAAIVLLTKHSKERNRAERPNFRFHACRMIRLATIAVAVLLSIVGASLNDSSSRLYLSHAYAEPRQGKEVEIVAPDASADPSYFPPEARSSAEPPGIPQTTSAPRHLQVDLVGTRRPVSIRRGDNNGPLTPVSLTKIDDNVFLIANYRDIYMLDLDRDKAWPLRLDRSVPIWNPTAVFYSSAYNELFIANYTGNDVLVASIAYDGDDISLTLIDRIVDPDVIIGPEGITVSNGGRYMAIANWEGSNIAVFERINGGWQFRWKQTLQSAHGITIIGNYVYGSGTTIKKFSVETGEKVAETNFIGPYNVLFTTCLNHDAVTGDLIGSDTMGGMVFTMDRNLQATGIFGANGPTHANLSMPYCVYRNTESMLILSTYQERIIDVSSRGTTSIEFSLQPVWSYARPAEAYRLDLDVWNGVIKRDHPGVEIFGQIVRPSYGAIVAETGMNLTMPARKGVFSSGWPYYVTTLAQDGEWVMITANSEPAVMLFNQRTGALGWAETGQWNCWANGSFVACPEKRYSAKDLVRSATIIQPSADVQKIAEALKISKDQLLAEITSEGGTRVRDAIQSGSKQLVDLATEYLEWTRDKTVPAIEYWLIWQLTLIDSG